MVYIVIMILVLTAIRLTDIYVLQMMELIFNMLLIVFQMIIKHAIKILANFATILEINFIAIYCKLLIIVYLQILG